PRRRRNPRRPKPSDPSSNSRYTAVGDEKLHLENKEKSCALSDLDNDNLADSGTLVVRDDDETDKRKTPTQFQPALKLDQKQAQKPKKQAKPTQKPPAPPVQLNLEVPNLNPPDNNPQQQQIDDEEMAQTVYPVFDGTNPRKWIFDLEIAFIANNILDAANARRIGLAVMNLGPVKMWYVTLNPKPTTWVRANSQDGFKELFLAKYATEANKAQASQQAQARVQRPTETVNEYLSALEEIWMECGDAAVIPEWIKVSQFTSGLLSAIRLPVKQQASQTMADAVQAATNCYYALQSTIQPSHSAEVNDALLEKIAVLEVQLAALRTSPANTGNNNNNRGFQQGNNNSRRDGLRCYYCGNNGHVHRECRIKTRDIRQGRKLNWAAKKPLRLLIDLVHLDPQKISYEGQFTYEVCRAS
ncbi:10707_t:CDS:2, partial [Paraglomus occultum]